MPTSPNPVILVGPSAPDGLEDGLKDAGIAVVHAPTIAALPVLDHPTTIVIGVVVAAKSSQPAPLTACTR